MPLALNIGKCTLLGNYRENNEDALEVKLFPDMTIGLVADGMGGQAAGEIASKRAIEVIPRELRKNIGTGPTPEHVKTTVRKAIVQANEEIMSMGALDRDLRNMGTTIVMALWRKGPEMYVANVGDSRAYLVRDEQIEHYCATIRNMGRAGIPILGYHFIPNSVWRTPPAEGRGGARVTAFDMAVVEAASQIEVVGLAGEQRP